MSALFVLFTKGNPSSFRRRKVGKDSHKKIAIPMVVNTEKRI
jgi:hypothetical protein